MASDHPTGPVTPTPKDRPTPPSDRSPRRIRRRRIVLVLLVVATVALSLILPLALSRQGRSQALSYGQFRQRLVEGRVTNVRLGPRELTGELLPASTAGKPIPFHTSRVGIEDDGLLDLLDRHTRGSYDAMEREDMLREAILPTALLVLMLAGLILVVRRGGLGSAMAFARSRHKQYGEENIGVTFDEVAGLDEAVEELREVVDFLREPEKFRALGGRIPKGILLVGSPGTGKTLLARAVAGEAGVPFFSLSGSEFVEMFVGVGAARVRNLFSRAEKKAPCLVFIDEIDAIGKARGSGGTGGHDERDQTLNQLLVALDGFDSNRGIIVLAATNRPETLDSALVRPGRFDRHILVDRPDLDGRERILQVHVKNVPLGQELNLRHIAAMTPGFVGADLANLVNEAALLAARKGKSVVDRADFEQGVERIIAGPEKKQRVLRPDEQRRIAVHEAGHALVSLSLPGTDPVHKVSIIGRGNGMGGFTMYRPEDDRFLHTQSWLRNTIRSLLGGTVAEELLLGEISDGASSDLQRASQIARKMVTDFGMSSLGRVSYQSDGRSPFLPGGGASETCWSPETAREIDLEVRRILDDALEAVRQILSQRRDTLEAISRALVERETLDASELQAILAQHG